MFIIIHTKVVTDGTDSHYDYMGKSNFIPARWVRFPPGIYLQRPIDSH